MIEDEFEVAIEPITILDVTAFKLKVKQIIIYQQTMIIPIETVTDNELLTAEIRKIKENIREIVNGKT